MFSKLITTDDKFIEMPLSSQCLYFHLNMEGDDEGFVSSPKRIMRSIGCSEDDLKILIAKGFVIAFNSGVVAIRHWSIHNFIRKDRKKRTLCKAEFMELIENENGIYEYASEYQPPVRQVPDKCQSSVSQVAVKCQTDVSQVAVNCQSTVSQVPDKCQHSIGEYSIGEYSIGEGRGEEGQSTHPPTLYGRYKNVFLTDNEHRELAELMGIHLDLMIDKLSYYMESRGKKYKSHKATLENWYEEDKIKLMKQDSVNSCEKYKNFRPAPKESDYDDEYDFCNIMRKENANGN